MVHGGEAHKREGKDEKIGGPMTRRNADMGKKKHIHDFHGRS